MLRGSNAIYCGGATGGIVSITTRPAGGEPRADTTVSMATPLSRLRADGLSANVQQHLAGSSGMLGYAFDVGARHMGNSYDANGQRLAPEPSQGHTRYASDPRVARLPAGRTLPPRVGTARASNGVKGL
ncbi:outer membrane receptor protein involved in Fe transport [Cupriavidus metallidurans]|nr:hypothetical protein AU374_03742 [Cupriavidus metallidurans]